jgi:uncharacterized repeat protein (TIGR02543 family)
MKIRNLFQIFLAVMMMAMFTSATEALAQSYTLGGDYVKFQKFVQLNPEEAAQYVVTTEAEEGETVTASIDPDKIPQGKYFTGVYTSQDVTLTTDWDGATFTMPAKDVTVNAVLAAQEDYTIDLTKSTTAVISEEISTLLSYMEVGGKNCSVYDDKWFLDLNVDGINDLEVKSTFDATTEKNIFSIEQLSGDGVYKNTCSFALNVTPLDRYKSLTFKFKEVVPVRTLQAGWITLSGDSFTYDGTEHKPAVTVVDGNTSVAVTVEYSKNKDAGEATVTVVANAENYTGSVIKTFTIKPMPVTISGVKANDKVYDGNARAVIDISGATIDGKVEGDELTVNAESVTAAFADANAGGGKTVTLSGNFTLAGTSAGNYVLSAQPDIAAGTIEQKEVTVSGLTAEEKDYDPNNNVATINCRGAVFNGLIEGDELTISDVTGTYKIGENVDATLDVTLDYTNATLGGKSAANYKLATEDNQATTIITIHKVSQTVTITFDPNGGTGEMDPMSAQKGETVRLTDNTFYRQGYSFKNWNTKADGSGDKYEDKQSIKIDEDLTLYAQWKEKNIIETNIETKKNLDGSTTTIVTSKETDSSGKLIKESNTSTTNFLDGSKKVSESKTPETDGKRLYVSEDGIVTRIDLGNSMLFGGVSRDNIVGIIQNSTQGSGESDAQPDILIAQGNESNVLVNKETEIDPQGEVTATSASLTVKQTGDTEGATGKSKPTQIAINAGGGGDNGGGSENPKNPDAPTSGKCGGYMTWVVSANAGSSVYDVLTISGSGQMDDMIEVSPWDAYHNQIKTVILESVISEEDNMEGVTSIGVMAFNGCSSLKSVTIPQSVTSIGQLAFYGCSSLTSVTIPAGVTSIGESAFSGCSSLTSVTIPAGVTSIGQSAFDGCSAMTSLTFAEGSQLQTIGKYAFDGLTSLTSDIILPAGVTSMGKGAFERVSENTTDGIHITAAEGSQLTAINTYAFSGANASIDLSNCSKLKAIGSDLVFSQVTGDVTLPSSVTSICQYAFENQYSTRYPGKHVYITVPDGKKLKVTIAGVTDPVEFTPTNGKADIINCLFDDSSERIASRALTLALTDASTGGEGGGDNGGGSENPDAPTSGTFGNLTWEVSKSDANSTVYDVLTISGSGKMKDGSPWSAYKKQIKTVIFESVINEKGVMEGVTGIGNNAFEDCSGLTSVTIPAGVTSIGDKAFNGCSSLKSVTIPAGVTSISDIAFSDCSAMTSLTFAEGSQLQTIGYSAFDGLTSLTSDIILPASVTSIGFSAFTSVSENTTDGIHITAAEGSRLTAIHKYAFSSANASIDLSNCTQLKAIGSDLVFSQVTGDVTLPSSVTSICQYAFENERSQPYPGNHVYITVPDGKKLKVTIEGVTDPVEITSTNGKADIINCLFDDSSKRIASRALTLEIVEASTGDEVPSTQEKNDRAATTMIVNYKITKNETGEDGRSKSTITIEHGPHFNHHFDFLSPEPNVPNVDIEIPYLTRGATAEQEEDDEIEIVSGREYEILHDGFIVLNFYTAGGSITVNSIIIRSPGDANNDGYVNAADIVEMINAKDDKASKRFNLTNADIDRDGTITQRDIDFVVKYIMEPKDKGDE